MKINKKQNETNITFNHIYYRDNIVSNYKYDIVSLFSFL